ncbi:hypothetical protein ACFQ60_02115 [Streptomyces zhihengii]
MRTGPGAHPPAAAPEGTATALVVFTSGTTGTPKGVAIAYADLSGPPDRRRGRHPPGLWQRPPERLPTLDGGRAVVLARCCSACA